MRQATDAADVIRAKHRRISVHEIFYLTALVFGGVAVLGAVFYLFSAEGRELDLDVCRGEYGNFGHIYGKRNGICMLALPDGRRVSVHELGIAVPLSTH